MKLFPLFYGLLLLLGISACEEGRVYEKNIDLENANWYADSLLKFEFEVKDISQPYTIYYNVRNTLSYPFYNMFVFYTLRDPKGKKIASELQDIKLMHSKTGEPFGSGLGDIYSHQLPAIQSLRFKKKGKYRLTVQQYMRRNPLPEVVSFGIKVAQDE